MLEFFQDERGIAPETLSAFGVDFPDEDTASFRYPNGTKYRRQDSNGERRFWSEPKGVELGLFGHTLWDLNDTTVFLVEGETDAMRLYQELDGEVDVAGIPGLNSWKPEYADQFKGAHQVYVVFDNDEDYKTQQQAERAWTAIRRSIGFRKVKRIVLPGDVKDLCEFFDKYNVEALELLVKDNPPMWHYEALDLTRDPGPIDWLVDGLIAKGDISLMIGEPGVGKSWISMSLAVAVAESADVWLGRSLDFASNRVLYVDEENPELLVLRRLRKLGLTDEGIKNIRFLHRQGVRLDRRPELLLDEALDWGADLIVLDSLTRMHTKDENNAGEIAGLFNDGINPLARETGATTLLLHHVTKTESPSAFLRARGSGDISASPDTGLDVRQTDLNGGFNIFLYKSRWVEEGTLFSCRRRDEGDNVVIDAAERVSVF